MHDQLKSKLISNPLCNCFEIYQSLIVSVLVCAATAGLPYVFVVFYKEKNEIKYKYEIRSLYISQKSVKGALSAKIVNFCYP
jgi:hypothetical protein